MPGQLPRPAHALIFVASLAWLVACGGEAPNVRPAEPASSDAPAVVPKTAATATPEATATPTTAAPVAPAPPPDPNDPNTVIQGLEPLLMACFESEFATNRKAAGSLTFLVSVAPKGAVSAAESTKTTLAPATVACMKAKIRATKFPARGFAWTFSNGYSFGVR